MSHICGLDILQSRQQCLLHQESRMHKLHYVLNQSCCHHLYKYVEGVKYCMFSNFDTWHSLCSKPCCTVAIATEQDDGVGKGGRRPGRVTSSRHTVIVFLKMSVRHDWEKHIALFLCYLVCEM